MTCSFTNKSSKYFITNRLQIGFIPQLAPLSERVLETFPQDMWKRQSLVRATQLPKANNLVHLKNAEKKLKIEVGSASNYPYSGGLICLQQ